ncbi:hypothetical protein [Burkholderia cepacia]|uniref:hypothetical protein n=1 Tax=Burkholderia cepacia TaxID=292 RepID=UPI000752D8AE|nr:hypothetical protein [Burkholderia cepacia]
MTPHAPVTEKGLLERIKNVDRLFALTVLVPTVLVSVYYGLIASDLYVSESTFVIRSTQKNTPSTGLVGAFLQGSGLSSSSSENAYAVTDYMTSRDALSAINQNDDFVTAYGSGRGDFISRFGFLGAYTTFEDLVRYFRRRVDVRYDTDTGITTLSVEGFAAADAKKFNEKLLELGEKRVNEMNTRAMQDTIRVAQIEVNRAEENVQRAAKSILAFRQNKSVFDPEKQSELQLQRAALLQNELVSNRTQLAQLQLISPANPQIPALKGKIANLEAEVANLTHTVTGKSDASLSIKSADYERLALNREFADKQLSSAMASLEAARSDAMRQQLYVERISQPNSPDKAMRPYRVRSVLTTFVLGLIVWGCLSLLIASVKEHRD